MEREEQVPRLAETTPAFRFDLDPDAPIAMARRLNTSQARAAFAEVVNRANFAGERTIIRRHGKDVAALVSAEDLKTLEALEDRLDLEEARQIMKKPGPLVSWEKIKKDLGL
jgi:prevent-host-death family protein